MWYDIGQTLTYNCLFNFVIGSRGCGKTYAAKKRAIKLFKDKGYQFVYLRRYKEELDETAESYFNDVILNNEFPDTVIEYRNGCYFVNDQLAGYAMALTKAKDYKSISYPLVYFIIFDEFLIEDNGFARYLKNEVKQFLNFYMSIDRYRGCTVFFLANSVSMINPYTLYFDLQLPYGSNIVRRGDLLLQLVQDEEFIKSRKETRFGKLVEGTDFAEYAIENKFVGDSKAFIMKKSENCRYFFTFVYEGVSYGVWADYNEGRMYVSTDVDPSCNYIYSLTVDDHKPNTMLISQLGRSPFFKPFLNNFKMGNVYFESQKVKSVVYDVLKLIMN
ncbi:MAG: phage DNA encapsidation protein [Clostridia bacterium]|nr:phage DNA encapsidation protein [Clostridia bacterium]